MTDDLKARLQAGKTGPGVDLLFHRWLTGEDWERAGVVWRRADGEEIPSTPYTTSIDAAYGVIPEGWGIEITADDIDATVNLWCARDGELVVTEFCVAPTLPCAILLAVIDARENQ
jgi:hypothetical protein